MCHSCNAARRAVALASPLLLLAFALGCSAPLADEASSHAPRDGVVMPALARPPAVTSPASAPRPVAAEGCDEDADCVSVQTCQCTCAAVPRGSKDAFDCVDTPCERNACARSRARCQEHRCVFSP
jgi:hypothetical protein